MVEEALQMTLHENNGTRILRLSGDLDNYTSQMVTDIADDLILGAKKLVINLDDLQYIDSSGLSALVWTWVEARDRRVRMTISCQNSRIHRILEITGLLNLFVLEASPAVSSLLTESQSRKSNISSIGSPTITTGPL